MFSNPKKKVATAIAKSTGVDVGLVSKVLTELANLAYANANSGFTLPGFGKFRLVPGKDAIGSNPFTGEQVVFRAPPDVEFTLDSAAKKGFLAGAAEPSDTTSDTGNPRTIHPIGLVPVAEDLDAAGVDHDSPYKPYNFKVGGLPDWRQAPENPVCCGDPMLFYGQLDSLDNQDYCIGDVGMIYVFFCKSCCASRSVLQF